MCVFVCITRVNNEFVYVSLEPIEKGRDRRFSQNRWSEKGVSPLIEGMFIHLIRN